MHTPASILMGVVFAPLGLVLVFTAAITPQWREGQARFGAAGRAGATELLLLRSDGLWESCLQVVHSEVKECWPVSGSYQRDARVRMVQGMVLSSLFPLRSVAAAGGLLVALAGVLSLAALGVYTHNLSKLGIEVDSTVSETQGLNVHKPPRLTLHPAGSLYFGWVGACIQVLGGAALLFGFKCMKCSSCSKQRLKDSTEMYEVNC